MTVRELYNADKLAVTLQRLAHKLLESRPQPSELAFIGMQPRGVLLSRRFHRLVCDLTGQDIPYGEVDATFYRDDFRRSPKPLLPNKTYLPFDVEGKEILLIDDVLYTGRTVRAALTALFSYGRPRRVDFLVLVDRKRKREIPIEAKYVGITVETLDTEKVMVEWLETHGADSVRIQSE